jgi:glycosyltransferase involved in cell wall biosynthesis
MSLISVTVVLPTHNPDATRLRRTLDALRSQTLDPSCWELLVVDNASLYAVVLPEPFLQNARVLREPNLGLTSARRTGFAAARGEIVVLVDDDNVLAPDYLERTLAAFARLPRVGALGGKSIPEFEAPPATWHREFLPLLALRDLGNAERVSNTAADQSSPRIAYPDFAPIGAGMALRRAALAAWLDRGASPLSDRRGRELTSGGDNDLVLTLLRARWEVAYIPELSLTHLIPASRLDAIYLGRLNRGIQKSWTQVLACHQASPWRPISPASVLFRKARAWFSFRAWATPAARIRWQGACGHFEGRSQPIVTGAEP